jgi:N-acetylmuramoyl-L-alanine amidase
LTFPAVLRPGSVGEAVRDLQRRLVGAGHPIPGSELGRFGPETAAALLAFQEARGLEPDGVCDPETWDALVESGYRLGDRLLYLRRPMQRGDDVAVLQRRLNGLGFDAGREDGILGVDTQRALLEFQRNAGLGVDGICGAATIVALERLGSLSDGSIAAVRERDELRRSTRQLSGARVYLAVTPGFEWLGESLRHELGSNGAHALLDATGDAPPAVIRSANGFQADLFVALRHGTDPACRCSYFESGRFRSETGYRMATAISGELTALLGVDGVVGGRTYALLRETRMAATVCEPAAATDVARMRALVEHGDDAARAIVRGIRRALEPERAPAPSGPSVAEAVVPAASGDQQSRS